jgi:phospholipid/cholesterol/gamma-HCH transport system substrate-binding protein
VTLDDGATAPKVDTPDPPATTAVTGLTSGGLGLANSPQENELITELAAPALGAAPTSLPDWTSVLLGPIYRGTEVTVK